MPIIPSFARSLALAGLLWAGAAAAQDFFASVDDLPLMAGLTEIPEAALMYDKPGGRIAEVMARGPVSRADIVRFYAQSLPQLGWRVTNGGFERDGEMLTITYRADGGDTVVHLRLNPK